MFGDIELGDSGRIPRWDRTPVLGQCWAFKKKLNRCSGCGSDIAKTMDETIQ